MNNRMTSRELEAAGVPKKHWAHVRSIATKDYRPSRKPHRAECGPFHGETLWLDDPSTGPIRVGDQLGRYTRNKDAYKSGNTWHYGVVQWTPL